MSDQQYVLDKVHYSKITYKKRLRLIEMIEKKHYTVYRAAKQMGISNSTAKLIMKNFKEEGRIFQKKQQKEMAERKQSQPKLEKEATKKQEAIEQKVQPIVKVEEGSQFPKVLNELVQLNNLQLMLTMRNMIGMP